RRLGLRQHTIEDTDEGLTCVCLLIEHHGLGLREITCQWGISRHQNASCHRDEVRGEDDLHGRLSDARQLLLDLRRMVMSYNAVGFDVLIGLAKPQPATTPTSCPRYPGLGVDDDPLGAHFAGTQ